MSNFRAIRGIHEGNVTGDSPNRLFPSRLVSAHEGASCADDGPLLDHSQALSSSSLDLADGQLDGFPIQWVQSQLSDHHILPALPQTDASSLHAFTDGSDAKAEHSSGQGSESKDSEDFPTESGEPVAPRKRQKNTEVHNLTEKKRRKRISVGIKTLHSLVPSSHKFDKVSMLDDVIEHIRFLQHQDQILSLWSSRVQTPQLFSPDAGEQIRQLPHHIPRIRHPPHKGMSCFRHGLHDMGCHRCIPPRISQPQPLISGAPDLEFSSLQMPIHVSTHASSMSFSVEALASFMIPP